MDLNQLLFHHQVALMNNFGTIHHISQGSNFDLVAYYEERIARLRRQMGVFQYPACF